jgi:SulP family sulfate permease
MPVIGGYLAYIGYYCGEAGISISSGTAVAGFSDWGNLTGSDWLRVLPALLIGAGFITLCRVFAHPHPAAVAVLPVGLIAIPAVFYAGLAVCGLTLADAQAAGWVIPPANHTPPFWDSFSLYSPAAATTPPILQLLPTWLAMVAIVAFSSSLDVAAIEMDLGTVPSPSPWPLSVCPVLTERDGSRRWRCRL